MGPTMRKSLLSVSLLALAIASPAAFAHQEGDIIVRAGAITVAPNEDSGAIHAGGAALAGTKATLDSDTQLGLNFAYMLTNNVAIELLAATPFTHNVGTKGLDGLKLGEVKQLPPTLSALYYPMESSSVFQPYVGLGINYTWFFDDKLSNEAEAAGFRGLDMKDSWGVSGQVGMDYMLSDNLMINGQVRYIDIDTTGTTYAGDTKVKVNVDVDPWVYMVGLGYKF
jgi:outer membrane protein